MTCIVAIEGNDRAFMACDSIAANEWGKFESDYKKMFALSPNMHIGFTTSFRMGQLLEFILPEKIDLRKIKKIDIGIIVKEIIPAIRSIFRDNGFTKIIDNSEEGGQFIINCNGKIFEIDTDFQVSRSKLGIYSVGAGYQYALGSMYTSLLNHEINKKEILLKALQSSEKLSPFVLGPFHFSETEKLFD